jgi:hypothetical protein
MFCVLMEMKTKFNNTDVYIQSINYCIIFIVLDIVTYKCVTTDGLWIGGWIY